MPENIFERPNTTDSVPGSDAQLEFAWEEDPFTFIVTRRSSGEVLFDSSAAPLIFTQEYIRLRTSLPDQPNIYGLGEHSDSLRLNTTNYTRTLWSRDAYGIPSGTNLYGNHPIYYDHRGENGTHGVFMLSSSGMDVKINNTEEDGQYLEYNIMGGVADMYFIAGPTPVEASQQYSEIAGKSAMMPYWGFGLHQCRYGYRDYIAIAEVIANYSDAGIPLETMWTDIDYMYNRLIMTTDPDRFPVPRMREIVDYLHDNDQHYIVMVDPAVAYQTERENNQPYDTFLTARDEGLFLYKNGSIFQGVVWPGVTAFPDWFHPNTTQYWIDEFEKFFSPEDGIDIDGLWIDMVSSFPVPKTNMKTDRTNRTRLRISITSATTRTRPRRSVVSHLQEHLYVRHHARFLGSRRNSSQMQALRTHQIRRGIHHHGWLVMPHLIRSAMSPVHPSGTPIYSASGAARSRNDRNRTRKSLDQVLQLSATQTATCLRRHIKLTTRTQLSLWVACRTSHWIPTSCTTMVMSSSMSTTCMAQ